MHIGLTKLLKVSPSNAEYNSEKRLREECTGADWGDNNEIEKAMATDNNKDDNEKHFQEKNRRLKKEKQYLKQVAARIKAC